MLELTKSQKRMIRHLIRYVRDSDFNPVDPSGYEFKRIEVTKPEEHRHVFLLTEVGLKGDEGTLASVFARTTRHYMIGPRGGLRGYEDKKGWIKGRKAQFAIAY